MTFTKTKEKLMVTTSGWDGTGYDGEAKNRTIYTNEDGEKFIKARFSKYWCYLKVTGERHKVSGELETDYFCDAKTLEQ